MDAAADVPYGPYTIQNTRAISIPAELMRDLDLAKGIDQAHWIKNPALPGTLVLVPAKMLARVMPDILAALRELPDPPPDT